MKQISAGSLVGLVCGIGVSIFSKPLAVILGLVIVGVNVRCLIPLCCLGNFADKSDKSAA
jgi:hypothetical protein